MLKNYTDWNACGPQYQPAFARLPERAQELFHYLCAKAGVPGIVKHPRNVRKQVGAGDGDVRALIRGGYVLALPEGQAMVIRCPYMRQWMEEYYEQNGHQPTLAELETAFG